MANENCNKCGNRTLNEGKLSGYASVQPINKIFSTGSPIRVYFCSKCGEVMSMQVENPEKFNK
ncbi:transcription initiation factor TFIIIB [Priestia abyssalis]|uniref:transcription initiation factor TFIIIB n=1 Tax=Priestia abyssalis TaxID=1221450 RepID=UPI00099492AE|nr:transcription initiation factor TFIIIB [Priestia abyssalis]